MVALYVQCYPMNVSAMQGISQDRLAEALVDQLE
jgi:hypothetical protein